MNPYSIILRNFYDRCAANNLLAFHLSSQMESTIEKFNFVIEGAPLTVAGAALILQDWSEKITDGWARNHHSGSWASIKRDNYEQSCNDMISSINLYAFSQTFELLTKFLKDLTIERAKCTPEILVHTKKRVPSPYDRVTLPSGDELFDIIASELRLKSTSKHKYVHLSVDLKVAWTVLAQVRHAITHQQGRIEGMKVSQTRQHAWLFDRLFPGSHKNDGSCVVVLNYEKLKKTIEFIASFAFQFFKAASISENRDWEAFIRVPKEEAKRSITIVAKMSEEDSKRIKKNV